MSKDTKDYLTIEFSVDALKAIGVSLGMSLNSEGTSTNLREQWTEIYGLLIEAFKNIKTTEIETLKKTPVSNLVRFKVGNYTFDDGFVKETTKNKDGCNHPYKKRFYCPLKQWFMKEPCNHKNMSECLYYNGKQGKMV